MSTGTSTSGAQSVAVQIKSLYKHRRLVLEMSKRELTDKYVGQALGWTWSILHPIVLMGVYVFVFAVVFKQRIGGTDDFPLDYTAYVLTGLVCWLNMQDSMSRTTASVVSKSELVKQVVFPIEILPIKAVLASLFSMGVTLAVLVTYVLVRFGLSPWTLVLGPLAIALQMVFLTGIGFLLGSIAVFVRDIKDVVQIFSFAGVYIIPAFYLPSWTPPGFAPFLALNPFSHLIWCFQDAFFYGRIEHPVSWCVTLIMSLGAFFLGHRLFVKLSSLFGNFL